MRISAFRNPVKSRPLSALMSKGWNFSNKWLSLVAGDIYNITQTIDKMATHRIESEFWPSVNAMLFKSPLLRGVDLRCNRGDGVCFPIERTHPGLRLPLWGLLKKLGCHEKESALEDYFLSLLLPLIGRRSRRVRELKELRPHLSRPVGTPSPGEAGEGKDRFLSFLAFSTIPLAGMMWPDILRRN